MKGQKIFWKKYLLLAVMFVWGFCFAGRSAMAAELPDSGNDLTVESRQNASEDQNMNLTVQSRQSTAAGQTVDLTVQLTETVSTTSSQVIIQAILPQYTDCDYKIYRAKANPVRGGKLRYLDSISETELVWKSKGTLEYAIGPERKIKCYKSGSMTGGVIFIDQRASLGTTYWYQVVLKDHATGIKWKSNIISGASILPAPTIKKCYTASNSSVKMVWTRISKARGYEIYRRSGSGSWKRIKKLPDKLATSYKDKKVKSGKTYQYKIRAYRKVNKKKVYSKFSDVYTVKTKNPSVKGNYKKGSVYGKALSGSKLTQVRRVVQSFKDNYIKSGMTDYEKLWQAFTYLRDNCKYVESWKKNGANTAWGALVYGEAQSSGYAKAMKALCDAIGISCHYVHANSKAVDSSHQWVQVKIDGKWYVVDAQGGYFLVGSNTWKNYVGMSWNTKGLPVLNNEDHAGGGIVSGEI